MTRKTGAKNTDSDPPKTSAKKSSGEKTAPRKNSRPPEDFLVVGLGASAGGIKPLKEFFNALPAKTGIAFVVVMHLAPERESSLAAILQSHCALPVTQVTKSQTVEPDRVYVIPPGRNLEMIDHIVRLVPRKNTRGDRVAIDVFFRSLADAYARNAVGIVFSGMGADGSNGLKRIKEANGFAIAQDPKEAEYDEMPLNAVATKLVDWILPAREMPKKLVAYRDSSENLHLTDGDANGTAAEIRAEASLKELLAILRVRTGYDFSNYKRPMLVRRIARHLQIHNLRDIPEFLDFLKSHPDEIVSLQRNLLINVTNFFRDKEAFEALEREVIPRLFAGKTSADTVRVWSAACASGEEAYSLAILLQEHAETLPDPPKFQIFATDADEEAIDQARANLYPATIEADVSPERLKRFFVEESAGYRIKKELREKVLFAAHNLLGDPPFSKLDLISCRNLLIYLNLESQERLFQVFHFALASGGVLFLGNSESAENAGKLFAPLDRASRLYLRQSPQENRTLPPLPEIVGWQPALTENKPRPEALRRFAASETHLKLLEKLAPPFVLVDRDFEVKYISESAGRFMKFNRGAPSTNLLKIVHPDLLGDLRATLYALGGENNFAESGGVPVRLDAGESERIIKLVVRGVELEEGEDFLAVTFEEQNNDGAEITALKSPENAEQDEGLRFIVNRLEDELSGSKARMRSLLEQHELTVEELKATIEESQAVNEELYSSKEELETSKEEAQSIGEELLTVNHELREKVTETTRVNSDLQNLMAATHIATIFLNRDMQIKRFTPPIEELFNIRTNDTGRPLAHFTHRLVYDELLTDAEKVLRHLTPIEKEIFDRDGNYYLTRIAPYRTTDDLIDGVVLNFIDITMRHRAEEALRESEEKLKGVFSQTSVGICHTDLTGRLTMANPKFLEIFGYETESEIVGKNWREMTAEEFLDKNTKSYDRLVARGTPFEIEKEMFRKDGSRIWAQVAVTPLKDRHGKAASTFAFVNDITERKRAEESLQASEERYRTLFESMDEGFFFGEAIFDPEGVCTDLYYLEENPAAVRMTGQSFKGRRLSELGSYEQYWLDIFGHTARTGEAQRRELYAAPDDIWYEFHVFKPARAMGNQFAVIFYDVTTRRKALEALLESERRRNLALEAGAMGTYLWHVQEDVGEQDAQMMRLFGRDSQSITLREVLGEIVHPDDREWYAATVEKSLDPRGDGRLDTDFRVVHADGSVHWLHIYGQTFFEGESLKPVTMYGTAFDITEKKRAEEALRESEEKFHDLFDSIDEGYFLIEVIFDENNKPVDMLYLNANPAATRMVGSDYTGRRLREISPDYEDYWYEIFGKVALTGKSERLERYAAPDKIWYNFYVFKVGGSDTTRIAVVFEDITKRKEAQELLRASEEKYRTLFETIDEGFVVQEVVLGNGGRIVDMIYHEANAAFEAHTGLSEVNGKRTSEIFPKLEQNWLDVLTRVHQTGIPERAEGYNSDLNRWISTHYSRIGGAGSPFIAAVFGDITERKRRELNLVFLADLQTELAPLSTVAEITETAGRRIDEYLNLTHCLFVEIDEQAAIAEVFYDSHDAPDSLVGDYTLTDFHTAAERESLMRGEAVVINDVRDGRSKKAAARFESLGLRSLLTVSYLSDDGWKFALSAQSKEPREWRADEAELLREIAARIYPRLERARAEEARRESEEKYRTLFESIDEGFAIEELVYGADGEIEDIIFREVNQAYERQGGLTGVVGKSFKEVLPNMEQHWKDAFTRVAKTGEPLRVVNYAQDVDRWFDVYMTMLAGSDKFVAIVFNDITERKRREANLALLDEIGRDLSILSAPDEIMQTVGKRLGEFLKLSGCYFVDVDEDKNEVTVHYGWTSEKTPSLMQTFKLEDYLSEDFLRAMRAGEVFVMRDTARDERAEAQSYARIKVGGFVTVPFSRKGRYVGHIAVTTEQAHDWQPQEIRLLQEISARIFPRIERARAEDALRESEGRLRALIENLPGGAVFVVDKDLRYLIAEGEALIEAGFKPEDLIGRTIAEAMPPELVESYESMYRKALAGEAFDYEHAAHNRSFITRGVPLAGTDGEIHAVLAISYDITDRKRAEEALRESEERLRIAVEAAEMATWDWDLVKNEVVWNERHFTLFGMKPSEKPQAPEAFFNHVHPDDQEWLGERLKKSIETSTTFEAEFCIVRADGKTRWMEGYGHVVERANGKPTRMSGVMSDVTNRKRAEQAVRLSEQRLQLVLKSITDYAVITTDTEGIINGWNTGAENTFGWTVEEAVGQPCALIFTPEDRANGVPEQEMQTALEQGVAEDVRWHIRKDGSRFFATGTVSPIRNGEFDGFVKITSDQTERMQAERIEREKEMLEKLVGAQENERKRIARDLHDELGQQLTALRFKLDNVKRAYEDDPQLSTKIDDLQAVAKRLDDGVDFLAWELRPASLDDLGLHAALEKYVHEWSHFAGVSAELLPSKIKKLRLAPETETNLYRIAQEAMNNIHKHAAAKQVEVMLERRGDVITLNISDDGKGFAPNTKNTPTTGIGLIGMKERAQLIGGTLEIESAPGMGTTIYVRVPINPVQEEEKSDER